MYFDGRKPGHEMDDTAASAADDRFEEMIRRVKSAGGVISKDDVIPLHMDFNNQVVEIGTRRTIEFALGGNEFQIIRDVKNVRMGGAGPHKHLEPITRPMIETKLKKRKENEEQWIGVDMEDLF